MAGLFGKLDRAIALGHELRQIHFSHDLHNLSRRAWQKHSVALGGFLSPVELTDARIRLEACPHLHRETRVLAQLWARDAQDRPALSTIFTSPEREGLGAAYAERLAAGLSPEQCSAIASWICAELRPDASFGKLEHFHQLELELEKRRRELEELDGILAASFPLRLVNWNSDGRAVLRHGGFDLVLDQANVSTLASSLADLVRRFVPVLVAAE